MELTGEEIKQTVSDLTLLKQNYISEFPPKICFTLLWNLRILERSYRIFSEASNYLMKNQTNNKNIGNEDLMSIKVNIENIRYFSDEDIQIFKSYNIPVCTAKTILLFTKAGGENNDIN